MDSRAILSSLAVLGATLAWTGARAAPPPGPYQGLKQTVAVYQFQTSDAAEAAGSADALTAMLTDALVRDGRFVVVEREDLANIATEQQLGAQASTTKETAPQPGQMIGASLILRGSVIRFDPSAKASGVSIGVPMGDALTDNSLGFKRGRAVVGIALRLIDAATGQVLAVVDSDGYAASRGFDVTAAAHGGQSISLSTLKETPLGRAAEDAIEKALPRLALAASDAPWTAAVIEVDGATVYVNAGAEQNLRPGAQLHVRRVTKTLTDPTTGVVLDRLMSDVGDIRIDVVRPKTSTAEVVDGDPPTRGDLLQPR
jgi:curli biogenesis system outer membrane secretion channel CsgG